MPYPLAGRFGAAFGLEATFLVLGAMASVGLAAALVFWPSDDPDEIPHAHPDLPSDHLHLRRF